MTTPLLHADRMRAESCATMAAGAVTLEGASWGAWLEGSLLAPGRWPSSAPRVLAFTGSMSGCTDEGDLRNWMPAGIERARAAIAHARSTAASAGQRLLVVPHALHLVSDVHSVLRTLREHEGVGLALAPAALLTGTMLEHAADHLARLLGTLGPMADAIILHGLERATDADGEPAVRPCPWGRGVLTAGLVEPLLPPVIPLLTLAS
jgi:hypothetical protein